MEIKRPHKIDQSNNNKKLKQEYELNNRQTWKRPNLPKLTPEKDKIIFQKIDIDYTVEDPIQESHNTQVPIIRIYGINDIGNSFQANIHGVFPYFYVQAPNDFKECHCELFRSALEDRLTEKNPKSDLRTFVLNVELVKKSSIYGYSETHKDFLKITVALPKNVPTARGILETSLEVRGLEPQNYPTFESDVPFILRWMIDSKCVGGCWIEIQEGTWSQTLSKNSRCQLEMNVFKDGIICHPPEGEWARMAPFRIFSFDTECAGRKGVFPEPDKDPVIQIANMVCVIYYYFIL